MTERRLVIYMFLIKGLVHLFKHFLKTICFPATLR